MPWMWRGSAAAATILLLVWAVHAEENKINATNANETKANGTKANETDARNGRLVNFVKEPAQRADLHAGRPAEAHAKDSGANVTSLIAPKAAAQRAQVLLQKPRDEKEVFKAGTAPGGGGGETAASNATATAAEAAAPTSAAEAAEAAAPAEEAAEHGMFKELGPKQSQQLLHFADKEAKKVHKEIASLLSETLASVPGEAAKESLAEDVQRLPKATAAEAAAPTSAAEAAEAAAPAEETAEMLLQNSSLPPTLEKPAAEKPSAERSEQEAANDGAHVLSQTSSLKGTTPPPQKQTAADVGVHVLLQGSFNQPPHTPRDNQLTAAQPTTPVNPQTEDPHKTPPVNQQTPPVNQQTPAQNTTRVNQQTPPVNQQTTAQYTTPVNPQTGGAPHKPPPVNRHQPPLDNPPPPPPLDNAPLALFLPPVNNSPQAERGQAKRGLKPRGGRQLGSTPQSANAVGPHGWPHQLVHTLPPANDVAREEQPNSVNATPSASAAARGQLVNNPYLLIPTLSSSSSGDPDRDPDPQLPHRSTVTHQQALQGIPTSEMVPPASVSNPDRPRPPSSPPTNGGGVGNPGYSTTPPVTSHSGPGDNEQRKN